MPQQLSGLNPAMACDDLLLIADEYGVCEPEPLDAFRDLLELCSGMRAGISGIGLESADRHGFYVHALHGGFLSSFLRLRGAAQLCPRGLGSISKRRAPRRPLAPLR